MGKHTGLTVLHRAEYSSFKHARQRCIGNDKRSNYGGRGIEFRFVSFQQFLENLGPRPQGKTLERKNNDGHYEPGNCCWATPTEQVKNRRAWTWKGLRTATDDELLEEVRRRGIQ